MSRVCELTGKGRQVGNNVSHANNKTKRTFLPNLQNVTLDVGRARPERQAARLNSWPALGRACRRPRQLADEDEPGQAQRQGAQAQARNRQKGFAARCLAGYKLLKFRNFPERRLHRAFSFDCVRVAHKPRQVTGFSLSPSCQNSLASRNEGGPVRVAAPGPIFIVVGASYLAGRCFAGGPTGSGISAVENRVTGSSAIPSA